jgi:formylglycine-generating enzyme required for sulfatase activity
LRHLAWTLAQRGLDQPGKAPALFGWADDARCLPLLLPLRTLASVIATQGEHPAVVSSALSAELSTTYNVRQADALVEQALHSGAAVLMFDGLDEVPLDGTPRRRADRHTVLRVLRDFVQMYPQARVVLTCRTRAFDEPLRATLGWHVEILAPFTLGQIRQFTQAWYGELVVARQITAAQAQRIGQQLIDAITDPRRSQLRALAATPLLLTLMALVLYNQGELPRDRPQLYERVLDLLLGQWDKLREEQSLAEAVGKLEWESRDFLPLLDRLCYEAHRDADSADGRGRLGRGALYTALIDFFRQARVPQPGEATLCSLDYFEQRSGLLAADGNDTYVFAHLTLQEHGAGRYIAVQSDDPTGLMLQHRADDRWREPILLGAGLLRPAELNMLLADLIDIEEQGRAKPVERWQRDLILAAEIGADRDWNLLRTRPAIKVDRLQRDLKRGLVELLQDKAQPLPVAERVRAGFLLGGLGDPRFPVTIDQWKHEIERAQAGNSSGYFCRVEAGTYIIGSADDDPDARDEEKPQHSMTFDAPFWIARYPITNAQWQAWVEQAGGRASYFADNADLNHPNQPVVGVTWDMCNEFCSWLSTQFNMTVRLPTEFEWESTARGGDARRYPWGGEWQDDCAATAEDQETRGWGWSVPVGCYPAGAAPNGALDLAGNVWEWTASEWRSYPGAEKPFTDEYQVVRGGTYNDRTYVRCGARDRNLPGGIFNGDGGFRVVVAPRPTNSR